MWVVGLDKVELDFEVVDTNLRLYIILCFFKCLNDSLCFIKTCTRGVCSLGPTPHKAARAGLTHANNQNRRKSSASSLTQDLRLNDLRSDEVNQNEQSRFLNL